MASAESSQDKQRGRDQQPHNSANARPRHRSESRRLSDRRRPVKATVRKRLHCPGALHEGDPVRVFSRSADKWVDGEVVKFVEDSFVLVEYEVGEYRCGKTLRVVSEHIMIPSAPDVTSDGNVRNYMPAAPVMQGCRSSLPIDPYMYYCTAAYMLKMVREGDVVLLKGSWLLQCFDNSYVLPRRQDLPSEAVWSIEELQRALNVERVDFISISHCWYTKHHPDPDGSQVRDVGHALRAKLGEGVRFRQYLRCNEYDLAIFWCWCSFFQEPRSEYQQEAFERSMEHMDLWYTNQQTEVWMLTYVPADVPNNTPYFKRGWTTWEMSVAKLLTGRVLNERMLLDLGALKDQRRRPLRWDEVRKACGMMAEHGPPLLPKAFDAMMGDKVFTKGKTDLELVLSNYQRNFGEVMCVAHNLCFDGSLAPFGLREFENLYLVLPFCTSLQTVSLQCCRCPDAGKALVAALAQHSTLETLILSECQIGDTAAEMLIAAISGMPHLRHLNLEGNRFSHAAEVQLSSAAPNLRLFEGPSLDLDLDAR